MSLCILEIKKGVYNMSGFNIGSNRLSIQKLDLGTKKVIKVVLLKIKIK